MEVNKGKGISNDVPVLGRGSSFDTYQVSLHVVEVLLETRIDRTWCIQLIFYADSLTIKVIVHCSYEKGNGWNL